MYTQRDQRCTVHYARIGEIDMYNFLVSFDRLHKQFAASTTRDLKVVAAANRSASRQLATYWSARRPGLLILPGRRAARAGGARCMQSINRCMHDGWLAWPGAQHPVAHLAIAAIRQC